MLLEKKTRGGCHHDNRPSSSKIMKLVLSIGIFQNTRTYEEKQRIPRFTTKEFFKFCLTIKLKLLQKTLSRYYKTLQDYFFFSACSLRYFSRKFRKIFSCNFISSGLNFLHFSHHFTFLVLRDIRETEEIGKLVNVCPISGSS